MLKVQDLQRFVDSLMQPLTNAGASQKVREDMDRLAKCLQPFREHSLAEFGDFLEKADTAVKTGVWPAPGKKPAAPRAPRAGKPSVAEMTQQTVEMHERAAADPSLEYAEIDAFVQRLKPLTRPQLAELATQVHVSVPAKMTKDQILQQINQSIQNRKGRRERTSDPTEMAGSGLSQH